MIQVIVFLCLMYTFILNCRFCVNVVKSPVAKLDSSYIIFSNPLCINARTCCTLWLFQRYVYILLFSWMQLSAKADLLNDLERSSLLIHSFHSIHMNILCVHMYVTVCAYLHIVRPLLKTGKYLCLGTLTVSFCVLVMC